MSHSTSADFVTRPIVGAFPPGAPSLLPLALVRAGSDDGTGHPLDLRAQRGDASFDRTAILERIRTETGLIGGAWRAAIVDAELAESIKSGC